MPELLKNVYTKNYLEQVAMAILQVEPSFFREEFVDNVVKSPWESLELKARMRKIAQTLRTFLPTDYQQALGVLQQIAPQFNGFPAMFLPDFVECFGTENYNASMRALEIFTQYSSSEFAIRPFIVRYPHTIKQLQIWAESDNVHWRRLASEGCRPRLPWAMALPTFKKNPQPILPIVEALRMDKSLYVRKSVANNLNDISKDHPQLVLNIAQRWQGQSVESDWIIRHGCRTLLKNRNTHALALFGFQNAVTIGIQHFYCDEQVEMGQALRLSLTLNTDAVQLGRMRVEIQLCFLRARGDYGKKVFHWFEGDVNEPEKKLTKSLKFQPMTTRQYHVGQQRLSVVVNGQILRQTTFELISVLK